MAVVKTFVVASVVVVGLIASGGTPEAEADAKGTGVFLFGTAWNAVKISGAAVGEVFGGAGAPAAEPAPQSAPAPASAPGPPPPAPPGAPILEPGDTNGDGVN
jgi:hypothetical protein